MKMRLVLPYTIMILCYSGNLDAMRQKKLLKQFDQKNQSAPL